MCISASGVGPLELLQKCVYLRFSYKSGTQMPHFACLHGLFLASPWSSRFHRCHSYRGKTYDCWKCVFFMIFTTSSHGAVSTQRVCWGLLGASEGSLRGLLGVSWGCLGVSWGFMVASWEALEAIWGPKVCVLGDLLGASCASWSFLSCSWGHLGGVAGVLYSFLGLPDDFLGYL